MIKSGFVSILIRKNLKAKGVQLVNIAYKMNTVRHKENRK